VRSVTLGFWIPVGSRDETRDLAGVTHFIEHLLFKGTQKYTAEEIAQIFDTLGGELNAATSREYVVVFGRFIDEQLPRALDVLVDMLVDPIFADLDREREVILEEIAMYEDSPQDLIHDLLADTLFDSHPLGRPVLGSRESISGMAEETIREYHQRHFQFGDMVVAAAGNVDHDQLKELLLKTHGGVGNGSKTPLEHSRPHIAQRSAFLKKETEQLHVALGSEGIPRNDERRYTLSVLDSLLGGSLSSRLFQEVREKRGLVYSIYSFCNMYRDTGLCGVYFGTRPDRAGQVLEVVSRELETMRNVPVDESELERTKEHLKGRIVLSMESTSARMNRLGKGVLTGAEILSLDEITERIDAVTATGVREMVNLIFDPSRMTLVGIGSEEEVFRKAVSSSGDSFGAA